MEAITTTKKKTQMDTMQGSKVMVSPAPMHISTTHPLSSMTWGIGEKEKESRKIQEPES